MLTTVTIDNYGVVDTAHLRDMLEKLALATDDTRSNNVYQQSVSKIIGITNTTFYQFFTGLANAANSDVHAERVIWTIYMQVLNKTSRILEKQMSLEHGLKTIRGLKREASGTYDGQLAVNASTRIIYDSSDWRYTMRELGKYAAATVADFQVTKRVSLAGPTKPKWVQTWVLRWLHHSIQLHTRLQYVFLRCVFFFILPISQYLMVGYDPRISNCSFYMVLFNGVEFSSQTG